jgi:hypothetical protein
LVLGLGKVDYGTIGTRNRGKKRGEIGGNRNRVRGRVKNPAETGESERHRNHLEKYVFPQKKDGLPFLTIRTLTKAVDQAVSLLPSLFSPGVVCLSCKDNTKCKSCVFSQQPAAVPAGLAV